jgi:hypothetical protein
VECAVGAHSHGGAQSINAFGATSGEGKDVVNFQRAFALAQADGFFNGKLVEGVERMLDAGCFDARACFVDAGFYLKLQVSTLY